MTVGLPRYHLCHLMIITVGLILSGCSSRTGPAPVISLSTKTATPQNLAVIEGQNYTVQAGDTLFAIAFYSGNDYRDLAKYNKLKPPYTIQIGQTLALSNINNIKSTNLDLEQAAQKTTKIKIDPTTTQEYGENQLLINRKNQKVVKTRSNIPDNNIHQMSQKWIWPAYGKHTVATVGSDGSKRGLDIKGTVGSKVMAAAGGKVVYAGNALKGYGNLVIIKHNDQYLSAYAHNQSILVTEQSYVTQGQAIATMGNSGASEVMLHFEIRKKGKSVDPFAYLPPK